MNRSKDLVPDRERCLELLRQYRVPEHVISHSLQVCRVSLFLGGELNRAGEKLDLSVVEAAALLHDITKIRGLEEGSNHAKTAGELLRSLGYERVAQVVARHVVVPKEMMMDQRIKEDELVNYADKRVLHDRIVTLEERFRDLQERYGGNPYSTRLIRESLSRAKAIESRIFDRIDLRPEQLAEAIKRRQAPSLHERPMMRKK